MISTDDALEGLDDEAAPAGACRRVRVSGLGPAAVAAVCA